MVLVLELSGFAIDVGGIIHPAGRVAVFGVEEGFGAGESGNGFGLVHQRGGQMQQGLRLVIRHATANLAVRRVAELPVLSFTR